MSNEMLIGAAAKELEMPPHVLRRLIRQGHVPAKKYLGGRYRIDRRDIPAIRAKVSMAATSAA